MGYLGKEMCDNHFAEFCEAQDHDKEDWARKQIKLNPKKKQSELDTSKKDSETTEISDAPKIIEEISNTSKSSRTTPRPRRNRRKRKY